MNTPHIYCLNYNNPVRRASMEARFKQVGITDYTFNSGVSVEDPRINQTTDSNIKRCNSCMFGHLDMIRDFLYNSSDPYAIFCEDDILIDADFMNKIGLVIKDFNKLKLDVLLLGCLISHVISDNVYYGNSYVAHYAYVSGPFKYFDYPPETVWGTQMYMITRNYARELINTYGNGPEHSEPCVKMGLPFSADWTITQQGYKRFLYPMLAIEDGLGVYKDYGQAEFHKAAHAEHLHEANYI